MTLTAPPPPKVRISQGARRFGYTIAIGVNAAMLYIAHQLLGWEWPAFLTEEFEEVLPIITVSFVASMVVNALYILYDAKWFKSLTQIGLSAISLVVTVRLYRVFPFDFSAYEAEWAGITKGILIVVAIGITIGLIAEAFKLVAALVKMSEYDARPRPNVGTS